MDFDLIKSFGGEELEKEWNNLFKSLGVNSFEELEALDKAFGFGKGKKDTSKLIPVKKEINRKGQTVVTTVYVSPKEAEEMKKQKKVDPVKEEKKKAKEEAKNQKAKAKEDKKKEKAQAKLDKLKAKPNKSAKDHKKIFEAEILAPYNSTIKELRANIEKWQMDDKKRKELLNATKDHYLITAKDESGEVGAVGAFKRDKDKLVMPHFGSLKKLKGAGMKIIKKLVEKAGSMGLGAEVHPPSGSHDALIKYGFKDELTGTLVMDADTTKEKYEGIKSKAEEKAPEKETEKPEKASSKTEKKTEDKEKDVPKESTPKESEKGDKEVDELEEKRKEHARVKKELRNVRKKLGSSQYKQILEHHGVTWEKNEHQGIDTMRASMAAAKFIKEGGNLDVDAFLKAQVAGDSIDTLNGKPNKSKNEGEQ